MSTIRASIWIQAAHRLGPLLQLLVVAVSLLPGSIRAQPEVDIEFLASFGTRGVAPGDFQSIGGVTVDHAGSIFVSDNDNHRIQICDYQGNCTADGSFGTAPGQFMFPIGIALDQEGHIVVADGRNFRIQVRDSTGNWSTFGSNGTAVGQFRIPGGVAIDEQNRIVVADENNGRVQRCTRQGDCTVIADGFVTPRAVAIDSTGQVLISDRDTNLIHRCIPNGACSNFGGQGLTAGRFRAPTELWIDSSDRLFIVDRDNHRFQVCDLEGSCSAFGGTGPGSEPGEFRNPTSVAVDSEDRIIIGDSGNDRIQIFQATYPDTMPDTYSIGGMVSGLAGSGLVLQNNGGDDLTIMGNGSFVFTTRLEDTAGYSVSVKTHPTDLSQTCTISNGSGTIAGADVTDVIVSCQTNSYTVGGAVSGLAGSGLVLQNNGRDDLAIAADGDFTFASSLLDGSAYSITVRTQPSGPIQTCTVGNAAGTLAGAHVTDVSVRCILSEAFLINAGLNDAWYHPDTAGQGFLINVFADTGLVFLAWFTFDTERPPESVQAIVGEPGHRWLTAVGAIDGNRADLEVTNTTGGLFDSAIPAPINEPYGTMTLSFDDCSSGLVEYDLTGPGISGAVAIQRVVQDNVVLCELLSDSASESVR